MRDIALVIVFTGLVFMCFRRAYLAPMLWAWISMMSPHRLTFGFAYNLPFGQVAAGMTFLGLLNSRNRYPYPTSAPAMLLLAFFVWNCVTAIFSFNNPEIVWAMWSKVAKIQILLFLSLMLIGGRQQINLLVAVVTLSVAFYGAKGGVFTILKGGGGRVWGPPGSFIEGNNELGVAFVMVIPLLFYLSGQVKVVWQRRALLAALFFTFVSTLGTHSRGALLAVLTMAFCLGVKSKRTLVTLGALVVLLGGMAIFMPESWTERMSSISSHEDHSAQSRLYTWQMILNMSASHPIVGGGYNVTENPNTWARYAVGEWLRAYSPHSIYFQALAEHGYVGLLLYLAIGFATWRTAARVAKAARDGPDADWVPSLMRMIQVSLMGFAVGGAFVNLVNYDLPYYLAAIVALVARDVGDGRRPAPVAQAVAPPLPRRSVPRPLSK